MEKNVIMIVIVLFLAGCATELNTKISYPKGEKHISVTASGSWPLQSSTSVHQSAQNVLIMECNSYLDTLRTRKQALKTPITPQACQMHLGEIHCSILEPHFNALDVVELVFPKLTKIPVHSYTWAGTCEQFAHEFGKWVTNNGN